MTAATDSVSYSRTSIAKFEKTLGIKTLVISHEHRHRIYSADLYNPSSDAKFEERSFVTDPFLIPSPPPETVVLFTPAPSTRDEAYSGTRRDWDMMPALARERITTWYGRDRSERVDLRESYLSRYKLTKVSISSFLDDGNFIEIGEQEARPNFYSDSSEGVTGSSL
ncbi:hypothetical protein BT96DRAFT_974768 [Gymnopus androsaceus JB14]|uniref:Uncharacterized protein n=1 Tax=Gymnopus androsaceus JB14 TaxID=1447944 RepID=A0A6A4HY52_9AGAR|nr:hypothetical protein BT96DRAFT_974768 [Gymnopus androsaceus JB14]